MLANLFVLTKLVRRACSTKVRATSSFHKKSVGCKPEGNLKQFSEARQLEEEGPVGSAARPSTKLCGYARVRDVAIALVVEPEQQRRSSLTVAKLRFEIVGVGIPCTNKKSVQPSCIDKVTAGENVCTENWTSLQPYKLHKIQEVSAVSLH